MDPLTMASLGSSFGALSGKSSASSDILRSGDINNPPIIFGQPKGLNIGEILRNYNSAPVNLGGHPILYTSAMTDYTSESPNFILHKNNYSTYLLLGGVAILTLILLKKGGK